MSETTGISWTDHTFNPWSGCTKVSPACANCYAANLPPSMRRGAAWGPNAERVPASDAYWREPLKWNRRAEKTGTPELVFCASVADVFEDRSDLDPWRERLWTLIAETPHLRWLLLTKRPERMARWADAHPWPVNAWAGTTVEDQERANERIPWLLRVPAPVRFLSCEPLLGAVDLERIRLAGGRVAVDVLRGWGPTNVTPRQKLADGAVSWVIAGGESGHRARPMHPAWARSLRDQCAAADVPFHFKQWGEWAPGEDVEANGTDWTGMYEENPDDGGAPKHYWPDGTLHGRRCPGMDTGVLRVGKKRAGRLLDGVLHDARPAP